MLAAKDYWFDNSFRRNIMKPVMNLIPIGRRSSKGRDISFDDTLKLSKGFMNVDKRCIIIFPEGTRGEPDILIRFKKGPARLAIGTGEKILPAVITGTGLLWPKGKIIFKPGKINVYILPPLDPKTFIVVNDKGDTDLFKTSEVITKELEVRIKEKIKELS